ncbi:MAG: hypothetical protein ACLFPL_02445 [Candidatus Nanoarchaeia archaeon]
MASNIGYAFGSNLSRNIPIPKLKSYFQLQFGGPNSDITPAYFWMTEFRNYTNKGFNFIKIEDVHHFSESSQFGANMRQIKGGGIRAFQENLNQIIQLIKVHLMPLLKEVKQAHMYKIWFDRILENDQLLFEELEKPKGKQQEALIKKYRDERNEAINHLKDKWVSEVDGGKLWQLSRSSQDQGLDMTLLPQLFFATYLDDPFERKQTLKEQLDESTYKVDITHDAKTQVARFQYRFYTWLPTAIKDTQSTFNIKLASLRQFYAQIEMHMQFMKPLLQEIIRKSETMHHGNFFSGFGDEDPNMVKLFDSTLINLRVLGPQGLQKDFALQDLEFTKFGLLLPNKALMDEETLVKKKILKKGHQFVIVDIEKNEKGDDTLNYIVKEFSGTQEDLQRMSKFEFGKIESKKIPKCYLKPFATPEITFKQERRSEIVQTQQGPQQVPFMVNDVEIYGHVWNFAEIAAYRQKIRSQDVHILESFIQELSAVKDELLLYLNYQEGDPIEEFGINFSMYGSNNPKKKQQQEQSPDLKASTSILSYIPIISDIISNSNASGVSVIDSVKKQYDKAKNKCENQVIEENWKCYNIYKKVNGYIAY